MNLRLFSAALPAAVLVLLLAPPAAAVPAPRAENLAECAQTLADTLTAQLGAKPRKVAVTPFTRLNAGEVVLGAQLADELDTALFKRSRKLTLVERRRLDAAVAELRLGASELFEPENLRRIGKFLGADTIIVGSIYEAEALHVVARAIRVETGDVLAAAEATLAPKPHYQKALAETLRGPAPSKPTPAAAQRVAQPAGIVFHEDFTKLKEGTAPPGWLGTDHFAVVRDERGTAMFKAFEPGAARFVIPGVTLPAGNFAVEWVVSRSNGECLRQPHMLVVVGNLNAGAERRFCTQYTMVLNKSEAKAKIAIGSPHRFELRRDGDIFTLWIDGTRALLVRKPDFEAGDTLVLNLDSDADYPNAGVVHSVTVRALE